MWRDNVASGRGKFFHIDGDVYDGKILFYLPSGQLIKFNRQLGK
jgi:hypothetical protein